MNLTETQRREPTNNFLSMLGRLKPGATLEQADAEVHVAWSAFLKEQAAGVPEKERASHLRQRASAFPAADGINPLRYDFSQSLLILMGTVALVLLLACVNLSGLLLARAASRQREVSIRLAIGAGRARLLRQFLTESLMLAVDRRGRRPSDGGVVQRKARDPLRERQRGRPVGRAGLAGAGVHGDGVARRVRRCRSGAGAARDARAGQSCPEGSAGSEPWPALEDTRRGSTRDLDDPDRWSRAFSGDAHQAVLGGQGLRQRRRARRQRQEHASVPGRRAGRRFKARWSRL